MDQNVLQNVLHPQPMQLPHNVNFNDYYGEYYWATQKTTLSYWLTHDHGPMLAVFQHQPPYVLDGEAYFSDTGTTPITVLRFLDRNDAHRYVQNQYSRDAYVGETEVSAFLATHRFTFSTPYFVDVVYSRLPTETVYTRFASKAPKLLFEYNKPDNPSKLEPVGFRPEIRNVLKKFLDALRKLHDHHSCHGNVQFGVWFGTSGDLVHIKILNFGDAPSDLAALANGIIDDLEQFSELVKHVINHNPGDRSSANARQTSLHSYDRFMDHIEHLRQARGLDLEEVRRRAYFIYNHPLFMTPAQNFKMLRAIFSIKRGNEPVFDSFVTLSSMKNWHKCIRHGDYLANDFDKMKEHYKSSPGYLLDFHVNVVKHHNHNNPHAKIEEDDEVIDVLYWRFPKFASDLYYEYAMYFNSEGHYPWMLRNDLLLQKGPFAEK